MVDFWTSSDELEKLDSILGGHSGSKKNSFVLDLRNLCTESWVNWLKKQFKCWFGVANLAQTKDKVRTLLEKTLV